MKCRGQRNALLPQLYASHFDEVLRDLGHALLTFVDREIRPVREFLVDLECVSAWWRACKATGRSAHLLECFRVIFGKRDLLPHLGGCMCAFDRLDVEV